MEYLNLGLILWIVLWLVFTLLVIDNLYLRRKIFKLYERLMFEKEKKASYREYSIWKAGKDILSKK